MQSQDVLTVLGGKRSLGRSIRSFIDLADAIEAGLPSRAAQHVKQRLQLTEQEFAASLGVSAKTLHRQTQRQDAKLTPRQGDRLYRLARIMALAEQVFEDRERARQWLKEPQRGLGNRTPLALLATEAGAREVEDLLGRIEYGVFS